MILEISFLKFRYFINSKCERLTKKEIDSILLGGWERDWKVMRGGLQILSSDMQQIF
jgi:hypothetical protein